MDVVFVGDASDRLAPAHRVAEAGVGADRLDIGCGGELDIVAIFEDIFDGEQVIAAALLVKSGGVGVAIENAAIAKFERAGNVDRVVPVQELFFDGFTFGMMADGAFATVAVE